MQECKVEVTKVAAAIDFSEFSEIAYTWAVEEARNHNAELVIVNVIDDRGLEVLDRFAVEGYGGGGRKEYLGRVEADRLATFQKEYVPAAGSVPTTVKILVGHPHEQLLQFIDEEGISLMVMGAKGTSNLAGLLFGSTAERVFRRANCPVLSVRGPEHCKLG